MENTNNKGKELRDTTLLTNRLRNIGINGANRSVKQTKKNKKEIMVD